MRVASQIELLCLLIEKELWDLEQAVATSASEKEVGPTVVGDQLREEIKQIK